MPHTYDNEKKPSQSTFSFKPTASFLQTRAFAPLQTDLDEDAPRRSGYTENFLEKIINQRGTESADTPVQSKPMNRLMKPLQSKRMAIQAKLSIGEPNDKYEQEADATASKVVQQINSPTQEQSIQREESLEEEDEELQMKPISSIQRGMMEEEEDELQMKSLLQRRGDIDGGEASTDLESSIQSARGSGQSLDSNLQAKMGQAMGADFSRVKVHTDLQSDQLNQSIQAKAFTTGQDVFFRQGEYNPSSKNGQELIAHELTHVVQQNGEAVRRSPEQSENLAQNSEFDVKSKAIRIATSPRPLPDISPKQQNSAPVIQRMVGINSKGITNEIKSLIGDPNNMDKLTQAYTFMQHISWANNIVGGPIFDMSKPAFNKLGNENLILVAHGVEGKSGHFNGQQIGKFLADENNGVPKDWPHNVYISSCYSGAGVTPLVKDVAEELGKLGKKNIKVTGYTGTTVTHKEFDEFIFVVNPNKEQEFKNVSDRVKIKYQHLFTEWWKKMQELSPDNILEMADYTSNLTAEAYREIIEEASKQDIFLDEEHGEVSHKS
ncbi:DUF4157 domain-containing protein [Pseudanabaena sp. BC1403]|uniref:eCIS core domain-containing protein n=1 Tax=Pseudanabaena sp. BC1403 TaxID=2043171 RepID=UPI00215642BF|nr:DUF4157 domain-containing protein [Pseudanabaena sp. BC1403]